MTCEELGYWKKFLHDNEQPRAEIMLVAKIANP